FANQHRLHVHSTTGTEVMSVSLNFGAVHTSAAMRTEFCAEEDHAKAGGAGDGGKSCATMFATRRITGGRGATHRAIERFSGHAEIMLGKRTRGNIAGGFQQRRREGARRRRLDTKPKSTCCNGPSVCD